MTSAENTLVPVQIEDESQGLCDLIGIAFRIWRRNLKLIIKALMVPTIVYFASGTVFQWCLTYGFTSGFDLGRMIFTGLVCFVSAVIYFLSMIFFALRQMALLRYLTGFSSDWQKALAYSQKKLGWMIGLGVISLLIALVVVGIWVCVVVLSAQVATKGTAGAIAGLIGMGIGIIGFFTSVTMMWLLGQMGFAVLSCEENDFFEVIGRTFYWTFKHFWRVLAFGCLFYIVLCAVSVPVSLPIVAASAVDVGLRQIPAAAAGSVADPKMSVGVLIFVQVWEAFCSLLLRPVSLLCFGVFYLDLRQRTEGLDIIRKLDKLKTNLD